MDARIAITAVLLASLGGACSTPPSAPAHDAAAPMAWRTLGSWSGRGDRQTESFDVVTGALRLRWEAVDARAPGPGHLKVSLYSAISGRPLQTIVDHDGVGADSATLVDEPRTSYLAVESAGVAWRLTLEESVPSGRSRP